MINRRLFLQALAAGGFFIASGRTLAEEYIKEDAEALQRHREIRDFCRRIPKAESHIHFPGMVYPDVALHLVKKNDLAPLSFTSTEEVQKRQSGRACWGGIDYCLEEWLVEFSWYKQVSKELANVLRSPNDVRYAVMNWIERSVVPSGTRNVELSIYHPILDEGVLSMERLMEGFKYASRDAKDKFDVTLNYIAAVRLWGPDKLGAGYDNALKTGMRMVEEFGEYKDDLPFIGITVLEELAEDIMVTAPLYDRGREFGWHTTSHLGYGEPNGVKRMWDGIKKLKLERLDHGYLATNDKKLIEYMAEHEIPLTVSPLYFVGRNYRNPRGYGGHGEVTWTFDTFPVREFYEKGMILSLDTDISGLKGYSQADEFIVMAEAYGYGKEDVANWARDSFRAAFISEEQETAYIKEVDEFVKTYEYQEEDIELYL